MKEFKGLKIPFLKKGDPRRKAKYLQITSCNMVRFSNELDKLKDLPCYDIECRDCLLHESNFDVFLEWLESEDET